VVNRHRFQRAEEDSRGAAAVEFALLLPILVLMLFGIIEFGRAYNTRNTITHAAREGVRAAAIDDGSLATATAAVEGAAPNLSGLAVTVSACTPGQPFTVTVSYDHDYVIPLFGSGTFSFTEDGTMRCGG
jgi:Flp pilus assembly protein TadG